MSISLMSLFLVSAQFISIYFLFHLTQWTNYNLHSFLLLISGAGIALWGILDMRKSKLRITPEVSKDSKLVTSGIYKYIRHPMYTGVLTACFGVLVAEFSSQKLLIYMLLTFVLLIKLSYEENLLKKSFSDYKNYMKRTKRLFPLIY